MLYSHTRAHDTIVHEGGRDEGTIPISSVPVIQQDRIELLFAGW